MLDAEIVFLSCKNTFWMASLEYVNFKLYTDSTDRFENIYIFHKEIKT